MEAFLAAQLAEQVRIDKEENKKPQGPKAWTDCTYDERHDYIESLRTLYKQFGLQDHASIDIHRQVGLNLTKGGQITSDEEFLFSENLFSVSLEDNLERFNSALRQMQLKFADKYDESSAVVMNESGYTVGDKFPEVRGLMHIKNDMEQQVFKKENANIIVALWSTQFKELNQFLEVLDGLAHEKKVKAVYAINVDRIFLYNEQVQKILIDKLNITFLRDSSFSNMNNLFSTRFVKNIHKAQSSSPFLIATDSKGKIALCEPTNGQKLHKIPKFIDNINAGLPAVVEKMPFVQVPEEEFESHFNSVVKEVSELASQNEEALELLK